jgi:hypothetical protein
VQTKTLDADALPDDEANRLSELANAYHVYNRMLLDAGALDFGDLIQFTITLLKTRPLILAELQKKIFKYYLVCKNVVDPSLLQSALQGVRKAIVSGKGGEAALKYSPDGTFVCPLDTIADNLKIMEEAITSSGGK